MAAENGVMTNTGIWSGYNKKEQLYCDYKKDTSIQVKMYP